MDIKTWQHGGLTIEVDYDLCRGHAECVNVCPTDVYELVNGKVTAPRVEDCIECCSCVEVCPEQAITHSSCAR